MTDSTRSLETDLLAKEGPFFLGDKERARSVVFFAFPIIL